MLVSCLRRLLVSKSWFAATLMCLLCSAFNVQAAQIIIPAAPQLAAQSYLLMDADTGKVLVEHNADKLLPPASLTKMMTGYVVSEEIHAGRLNESDLVTVSDDAWRRGGFASGSSTMALKPGSKVSVIDLMRGMIIQSGNDASIALAQHISGSEAAFADVMNQQAQLLGMVNTTYKNATGWPAEGHLTTARDLARLARAMIKDHPDHYAIHAEKYFKHNGINQPNRNKLLFRDKSVDGIKTGHTKAAGYCLVSSAKRNDMRLIAVVMGAHTEESRAAESQRLLAYGFRYYATHKLYSKGEKLGAARVWGGEPQQVELSLTDDLVVTIPRGSYENLVAKTHIDTVVEAPVTAGQELGHLQVTLDGEPVADKPLQASATVAEAGFFARLWDQVLLMVQRPNADAEGQ